MKASRSLIAATIGVALAVGASNLYAQSTDKPAQPQQSEKRVEKQQMTCPCCGAPLSEEAIKKLEAFRAEQDKFRGEREKFRQDRREFGRGDRPMPPMFGRGEGPRFQPRPFDGRRSDDAPAAPQGARGRSFRGGRPEGAPPMMERWGGRPSMGRGRMMPPPPPDAGSKPAPPDAPQDAPNDDAQQKTDKQ